MTSKILFVICLVLTVIGIGMVQFAQANPLFALIPMLALIVVTYISKNKKN